MSERRTYQRTTMNAQVRVIHPAIGERVYSTRDVSDGGIFVVVESDAFPPIGSVVEVQVQGMPVAAPVLRMEVVRHSADGYGLQFI